MTKNISAPHLPPMEKSQKSFFGKAEGIFGLALIIILSFLAGLSATLSVFAWLLPTGVNTSVVNTIIEKTELIESQQSFDEGLQNSIRQKMLSIYDKRVDLGEGVGAVSSRIGKALLLSSDGYAVFYGEFDTENPLQAVFLEAIDYKGDAYEVEKLFVDEKNSLIYLKIEGKSFASAPFASWDELSSDQLFWTVGWSQWKHAFIREFYNANEKESYNIHDANQKALLSPYIESGSLVFDGEGAFIGFVDSENILHWGWSVEAQLKNLLSQGKIDVKMLPFEGTLVDLAPGLVDEEVVLGFFLDKDALSEKSDSLPLKKGDIIVKIDGKLLQAENISNILAFLEDNTEIEVWRDNEVVTIEF